MCDRGRGCYVTCHCRGYNVQVHVWNLWLSVPTPFHHVERLTDHIASPLKMPPGPWCESRGSVVQAFLWSSGPRGPFHGHSSGTPSQHGPQGQGLWPSDTAAGPTHPSSPKHFKSVLVKPSAFYHVSLKGFQFLIVSYKEVIGNCLSLP